MEYAALKSGSLLARYIGVRYQYSQKLTLISVAYGRRTLMTSR